MSNLIKYPFVDLRGKQTKVIGYEKEEEKFVQFFYFMEDGKTKKGNGPALPGILSRFVSALSPKKKRKKHSNLKSTQILGRIVDISINL